VRYFLHPIIEAYQLSSNEAVDGKRISVNPTMHIKTHEKEAADFTRRLIP